MSRREQCTYCGYFHPLAKMTEVETDVRELDDDGKEVKAFACSECLYGISPLEMEA